MKVVAHLLMVYKDPQQLLRLVNVLQTNQSDVFVHVDKKFDIEPFRLICPPTIKFIENRKRVNWGGYSLIEAVISSINEIQSASDKYQFVNILSGQDFPIKPIASFEQFLKENTGKCFISFDSVSNTDWWKDNIIRITRYHLNDLPVKGKYTVQKVLNKLSSDRKFPQKDWQIYGGNCSSWWTIPSDAALYFAQYMTQNKRLKRFAKFTWAPDEYIYATVLMNSIYHNNVVNNNYRYIDWSEKKANPKTLKTNDFEKLQDSNNFFARKFDLNIDGEVVNLVTEKLL